MARKFVFLISYIDFYRLWTDVIFSGLVWNGTNVLMDIHTLLTTVEGLCSKVFYELGSRTILRQALTHTLILTLTYTLVPNAI